MRLPVVPQISTKDGVSNKNARLTNCLKESKKGGDKAVVRPGLVLDATASGVGHGLVVFDNNLVSVYGATLGFGVTPATDVTSTFYNISDQVLSMVKLGSNYLLQTEGQIYSSSDLVSFTPLLSTIYILGNLETNGTVAVCGMDSDDTGDVGFLVIDMALTATEVAKTYNPQFIVWNGTKFCAFRSLTRSVTSTDGTTWVNGTTTSVSLTSHRLAYGGGIFVRVGVDTGAVYSQTSSDGDIWGAANLISGITTTYGQYGSTMNLIYAGDRFVFSGRDWVTTSTDGVTWASEYPYPYNFDTVGIAYNSTLGEVLTLGSYATYGIPQTKMISTDNGLTWIDTGDTVYNGIQYNGAYSTGSSIITFGSTVVSGASNNIEVVSAGAAGSIPALATITGDYYDFAQSPL